MSARARLLSRTYNGEYLGYMDDRINGLPDAEHWGVNMVFTDTSAVIAIRIIPATSFHEIAAYPAKEKVTRDGIMARMPSLELADNPKGKLACMTMVPLKR